jgi:hypothetical protein
MDEVGRRAPREGIGVLHPLFDALPPAIRERARAMVESFDPASVAATTHFMATGAQPFATGGELAAIACPVLVVPGTDPTHPASHAEAFRRHLSDCRVVETPDLAAAIAAFTA